MLLNVQNGIFTPTFEHKLRQKIAGIVEGRWDWGNYAHLTLTNLRPSTTWQNVADRLLRSGAANVFFGSQRVVKPVWVWGLKPQVIYESGLTGFNIYIYIFFFFKHFSPRFRPPQHCQQRARKMPFTTTEEAFRWFLGTNSMVVSGRVCGTSMSRFSYFIVPFICLCRRGSKATNPTHVQHKNHETPQTFNPNLAIYPSHHLSCHHYHVPVITTKVLWSRPWKCVPRFADLTGRLVD